MSSSRGLVLQAATPNSRWLIVFFDEKHSQASVALSGMRSFEAHYEELFPTVSALKNSMLDRFFIGVRRVTCHFDAHANVRCDHILHQGFDNRALCSCVDNVRT